MTTPGSNRKSPVHVQYFQNLADSIGIFWQFHDERVRTGNMDFAYSRELTSLSFETGRFVMNRYDPQEIAEQRLYRGVRSPQKVVWDFGEGVKASLQGSWLQFLEGNGFPSDYNPLGHVPVPKTSERFFDPFVREKLLAAQSVGPEASRFSGSSFNLSTVVSEGAGAGAQAVTQLNGLFGEDFDPVLAIALSKIKGKHQTEAAQEIGTIPTFEETHTKLVYTLLDDSSLGLDRKRLREFGAGDTLGCPASMKVSPEAGAFLEKVGSPVGNKTMLADFAARTSEQFDTYVGEWVRGLSPIEKQVYIDPEQLHIITGETRREAIQAREQHGRPYKER